MSDVELRALAEAATPGPWTAEPDTGAGRVWVQRAPLHHGKDCEPLFNIRDLGTKRDDKARQQAYAQRVSDAAYIAACSPDVALELLDRLATAKDEIEQLTEFGVDLAIHEKVENQLRELRVQYEELRTERAQLWPAAQVLPATKANWRAAEARAVAAEQALAELRGYIEATNMHGRFNGREWLADFDRYATRRSAAAVGVDTEALPTCEHGHTGEHVWTEDLEDVTAKRLCRGPRFVAAGVPTQAPPEAQR